eukprot:444284_1
MGGSLLQAMAMYIHSADMSSSESCGVHDDKFSEFLRTCGNDDPSNYNDSVSRAAVRQLLKRTASRWAGVRGEPGYAALSWLVYRMLVEINLKESHKETTEEEEVMSMMTDSEQAVVVHHHHSVPNTLLDCQAPILQKCDGCITPRNEEEEKLTEEDSIDRYKKLRESKISRNESEKQALLLKECIRFHHSEGLKLENWHASRMVARKAITNGKIQLAMSTLENECAQAEMELQVAVTTSDKWKEKVDMSNLATMKIEEVMKSYLKQENCYSIIRRGLIDEFSSRRGQHFGNYDLKVSTLPPRVRMKELIAAQTACETQRVAEEAMAKECNILETKLKIFEEDAKIMESDDFFLALRRFENTHNKWKRCSVSMLETMTSLSETRKELARIHLDNVRLKLDVEFMENSVNLLGEA